MVMSNGAVCPLAGEAGVVTDTTRVAFHPLHMRNDGDMWVIGRMDTGDFASGRLGHRRCLPTDHRPSPPGRPGLPATRRRGAGSCPVLAA
jgi:hypothetical protein